MTIKCKKEVIFKKLCQYCHKYFPVYHSSTQMCDKCHAKYYTAELAENI